MSAEAAFREAFNRLKSGKATRLPKTSSVSQNNVAKEAGCDPSALRKSRYPTLIAEIQSWVVATDSDKPISLRQKALADRSRQRILRGRIEELKAQRDLAYSLLAEADARIVELTLENARLAAKLEDERVPSPTPLRPQGPR